MTMKLYLNRQNLHYHRLKLYLTAKWTMNKDKELTIKVIKCFIIFKHNPTLSFPNTIKIKKKNYLEYLTISSADI